MTVDERELERLSLSDSLWAAYAATVMEIAVPSGVLRIVPSDTGTGDSSPLPQLHVITACNPASAGPRGGDAAAMDALRGELTGHQTFEACGQDPRSPHREDSIAVIGLSDDDVRVLGRRYGQVAVFGLSGPVWSLIACSGTSERIRHGVGSW